MEDQFLEKEGIFLLLDLLEVSAIKPTLTGHNFCFLQLIVRLQCMEFFIFQLIFS